MNDNDKLIASAKGERFDNWIMLIIIGSAMIGLVKYDLILGLTLLVPLYIISKKIKTMNTVISSRSGDE
jgi:hypothetical protein